VSDSIMAATSEARTSLRLEVDMDLRYDFSSSSAHGSPGMMQKSSRPLQKPKR